ncbi:RagB/SusD family nutrient uptake outer membrane protein [Segetibacter koreensis]|uniref:RagB/SusD family nutrient uptake outer membrane protein n=1 Tax=Segetibacter koreensis TaxID=398037 RepID=UPI0003725E43|nr:RagB/SusD family nutrient uptake outer membrane protein [Segetibacter koreensis]
MKKKQYKVYIPACLLILFIAFGCKKSFLDKQPLGSLSETNITNKAGVQTLLIGAYSLLDGEVGLTNGSGGFDYGSAGSNWVYGSMAADDSYKGSVPGDQPEAVLIESWSVSSASTNFLNLKWTALYNGIQRSNEVLRILKNATDLTDAEKIDIRAEARFLRGFYHLDAKKMWNNIPYVDENITYINNNLNAPNIDASGNFVDIWPNIEADLKAAADSLPETQPQAGRINKWGAMAFLAKAYMFEHKYIDAKPLLEALIANGVTANGQKYALVNFENNFNAATKNSPESVFACQSSVNDGSALNGNYGDVLNFPNGAGAPGGCCGFNNPSYNLANAYKTDPATGLPLLDTWNSGPVVNDDTNPYTGTLDPRIDLTMGRPGIPYLDWGIDPVTKDWIRDPNTNGVFSPRKNVYAKSQFGTYSSNETSFWGATQINSNNYTFIRFADIILWAAECETEIGSPDKAQDYVNQIRSRAADPTGWVYKNATYSASTSKYSPQTTPADNYKIGLYAPGTFSSKGQDYARKAVRFERRLELAMEGHRFFDLQRWDSGTGYMSNVLNTYQAVEKTRKSFYATNPNATFHKGVNEYYAIPQKQIDIENSGGKVNLKQNPGYN